MPKLGVFFVRKMCHEMDFTLLQFDKEADTKSENSYGRGTRRF